MKVIVVAGGTGGHIYPAVAIINKIKEEDKKSEILYIGTTDRMEKDIIPKMGINFIGLEKYSSVGSCAIKKMMPYELNNLKVLIMDVVNIPDFLHGKIARIYLNFSDPWPKDRHAKRRLTHENFLKIYDPLFKDKKQITLKTDNDALYAFSRESLLAYGYQILEESLDLHSADIDNVKTEYERKFSEKGFTIKYIKVEKN